MPTYNGVFSYMILLYFGIRKLLVSLVGYEWMSLFRGRSEHLIYRDGGNKIPSCLNRLRHEQRWEAPAIVLIALFSNRNSLMLGVLEHQYTVP